MKSRRLVTNLLILGMLFSTQLLAVKMEINKNPISEEKKYLQFEIINELKLEGNFKIEFIQGSNSGLFFKGDPTETIEMDQENQLLIITQKSKAKKQEITITLPNLSRIQSNGILTFIAKNPIVGENLILNLNGVTSLDLQEINFKNISGTSSGVSLLVLKGKADQVDIDFNGFGLLDEDHLKANVINVKNNSVGLLPILSEMIRKIDKL